MSSELRICSAEAFLIQPPISFYFCFYKCRWRRELVYLTNLDTAFEVRGAKRESVQWKTLRLKPHSEFFLRRVSSEGSFAFSLSLSKIGQKHSLVPKLPPIQQSTRGSITYRSLSPYFHFIATLEIVLIRSAINSESEPFKCFSLLNLDPSWINSLNPSFQVGSGVQVSNISRVKLSFTRSCAVVQEFGKKSSTLLEKIWANHCFPLLYGHQPPTRFKQRVGRCRIWNFIYWYNIYRN